MLSYDLNKKQKNMGAFTLPAPCLPSSFSPALAVHLLQVAPETLSELRASGVSASGRRGRISRQAIETLLGRALTADEILAADSKLEPRRATQARYYDKRKARSAVRPPRPGPVTAPLVNPSRVCADD